MAQSHPQNHPMTPPRKTSQGEVVGIAPYTSFVEVVSRDFAREHLIFVREDGDRGVAMVSPRTPSFVAHNVGVLLGNELECHEADEAEIASAIDAAYSAKTMDHREQAEHTENADASLDSVDAILARADRDLLSTEGKGPIIKLTDAVLFESLRKGASDVHVHPLPDRLLIRYRVDGVLHDARTLPANLAGPLVSRVKVMGRMDIAERRIPQDGRATVSIGDRPIDLRISTIPTSHGERAVLRLLDHSNQLTEFEQLGMPQEIASRYLKAASRSTGLILVTGPTGSGKTTTLYATLRKIGSPELNILTIEDPIEYELASVGLTISQSQINEKKGVTFPTGLRHILRQDPDVVMVGEVRDTETARIAVQASLTGHLVLTTLHTNDASSAVTRLIDLGVEPFLVSASLSAVLAQRLVRTLHQECSGEGCDRCGGLGYKGRAGVFELLSVAEAMRTKIAGGSTAEDLRGYARSQGQRSLADAADAIVESGVTSPAEAARVVEGLT